MKDMFIAFVVYIYLGADLLTVAILQFVKHLNLYSLVAHCFGALSIYHALICETKGKTDITMYPESCVAYGNLLLYTLLCFTLPYV